MKSFWVVTLVSNRQTAYNIYGADYFPRRFHYKKDAIECQKRLKELGLGVESTVVKS
jgi:hypothetical protein